MSFLFSLRPPDDMPLVPPQLSYLTEYVLSPFYDLVALYYPTWWDPNKLTLFGILMTLLSSFLLLTGMPPTTLFEPPYATLRPASLLLEADSKWLNSPAPTPLHPAALRPLWSSVFPSSNWMLFFCGLLNGIYCVADNTDGRLARRLKKTSNIGEYLDHGLDCVTSLLSTCVGMSVIGISFSNIAFTVVTIALATVFSHILNYEKHIFIWGNRFISVDEAMVFFCVVNWIPIAFPGVPGAKVSPALLYAVLPEPWAQALLPLRYIEVLMIIYWASQIYVILGIASKNWKMLFRLTTLAVLCNSALLLGVIPYHTQHLLTVGSAGYALGPFSYVALWFITVASTSSTVVHTLVYAHCLRLPRVDASALAGLFFVWPVFLCCPAAGMLISVVWHIAQIVCYVRSLQSHHDAASRRLKAA
ncbi:putative ethanolamine phosphotransferase [Trypanosoma conorhini]|uniref:Putative ethanolamine phosphotransferase n=1 Tax=Trypanosoma conorhini TaxID=83891 RepID=A0A422Q851_9TRYP|nr:putative ethanolamine phosphotransferase [Trypanosoma conorhini]RNF26152.1 putative ethanolamine phosphotransferase [Trypanosoma conorhini]